MYRPLVTLGRIRCVALVALTLGLTFALRYPTLFEPRWYGDEGIFASIAVSIRAGETLYVDAWDNKPPLIFFTYGGIQALFGTEILPLHATVTAAVLMTQVVVAVTAAALASPRHALLAALVFALLMGTPVIEGNLALTETFMILPVSLAVLTTVIASRRSSATRGGLYVASGALLGIGASYKQVAVFDAIAIAAIIWSIEERPLAMLWRFGAGFALPHAALAVYFVSEGAFVDYWQAVVWSLFRYADTAPELRLVTRIAGILPALIALAWLVARRQRGERDGVRALPAVWLAFAVAGSTASTFAFPHYLQQAAAPLALAIAVPPFGLERRLVPRTALAGAALVAAIVVYGQFGDALQERRQLGPDGYYRAFLSHKFGTGTDRDYDYYFDGRVETVREIAAVVREDGAGDTLFAWADLPWIYAEAGVDNPTKFPTSFMSTLPDGGIDEALTELVAAPPAYVLMSDSAFTPFPALDAFVAQRYVLLEQQGDWRLYRLATLAGRLSPETATNVID